MSLLILNLPKYNYERIAYEICALRTFLHKLIFRNEKKKKRTEQNDCKIAMTLSGSYCGNNL